MEKDARAEKHRPSLGIAYREFAEGTSMHRLKRVVGSKQIWRRFVWGLLVMGGAGWGLYQLINIVQQLRSHPVLTVVSSVHRQRKLEFPKFTICNRNVLRWSQIPDHMKERLLEEFPGKSQQSDLTKQVILDFQYTDEKLASMGHSMKDMLLSCTFNQESCLDNITFDFFSSTLGNCFTFGENTSWSSAWPGPGYGLTLELDIQQYDYSPVTSTAGIAVMITPRDVDSENENRRYLISPGFSTSLALKRTTIHRLPLPYGRCLTNDLAGNEMLRRIIGDSYVVSLCHETCYQVIVYTKCKCCDETVPCNGNAIKRLAGKTADNSNITLCGPDDHDCLEEVDLESTDSMLKCEELCPPRCDETIFEAVPSFAAWPAAEFLKTYAENLAQNDAARLVNVSLNSTDEIQTFIRNNLLRLEVFYETAQHTKITTVPAYDWSKVLGEIGGNLGLWLGFSLLTAVEVLELLLDTVAYLVKKTCKKDVGVHDAHSNR